MCPFSEVANDKAPSVALLLFLFSFMAWIRVQNQITHTPVAKAIVNRINRCYNTWLNFMNSTINLFVYLVVKAEDTCRQVDVISALNDRRVSSLGVVRKSRLSSWVVLRTFSFRCSVFSCYITSIRCTIISEIIFLAAYFNSFGTLALWNLMVWWIKIKESLNLA